MCPYFSSEPIVLCILQASLNRPQSYSPFAIIKYIKLIVFDEKIIGSIIANLANRVAVYYVPQYSSVCVCDFAQLCKASTNCTRAIWSNQ